MNMAIFALALLASAAAGAQALNASNLLTYTDGQAVPSQNATCEVRVGVLEGGYETYMMHPRSNCTKLQLNMNMTAPANVSKGVV